MGGKVSISTKFLQNFLLPHVIETPILKFLTLNIIGDTAGRGGRGLV